MIQFTSIQLNAWLAAYFFPLARVLALMTTAPPFNYTGLPRRIRLVLGLALTVAIAPTLPPPASLAPSSGQGLLMMAEQMLIGVAMGFSMRFIFSAVDLAGNIISYQMGLSFATSYDPLNAAQTPVISEFIGFLALLVFLAIDGHLMVVSTLIESFKALPIGEFPEASVWLNLAKAGSIIFSAGLFLALPIVVALLITNIALGILGRVSPQLNLTVIGFPTTIFLGLASLYLVLPELAPSLLRLFETGLSGMLGNISPR